MYFPFQKGRYEVAPGLLPLTQDFGNGAWDQRLFQIGNDFQAFRTQFDENRTKEAIQKYVILSKTADSQAVGTIAAFILKKIAEENQDRVGLQDLGPELEFQSNLTHERFRVSARANSVKVVEGKIHFENAWDAAGAQVPEDLAIWKLNEDGSEEIEALHLNAPNHWAAQDKIGRSFASVHAPIAHIEKIVPWAVKILNGIIKSGPYVRFAWGVGTDQRLNHHPTPPPGIAENTWSGRRFDLTHPKLYTRVERQVLWGFPELNRALFSIRTYFHDVEDLKFNHKSALEGLKSAIECMTPEALVYKGLVSDRDAIISYLCRLIS
jgi:hypothetical protein